MQKFTQTPVRQCKSYGKNIDEETQIHWCDNAHMPSFSWHEFWINVRKATKHCFVTNVH